MPFPQQNPSLTQPQQLQLPSNQPRPTQLLAQPVANPSNKMERPAYNVEEVTYFPTYFILPIQDVHLRSGKVLHKDSPSIIEEQTEQGEQFEKSHLENQIQKGKEIMTQTPPYPERLVEQKIKVPISPPKFNF